MQLHHHVRLNFKSKCIVKWGSKTISWRGCHWFTLANVHKTPSLGSLLRALWIATTTKRINTEWLWWPTSESNSSYEVICTLLCASSKVTCSDSAASVYSRLSFKKSKCNLITLPATWTFEIIISCTGAAGLGWGGTGDGGYRPFLVQLLHRVREIGGTSP